MGGEFNGEKENEEPGVKEGEVTEVELSAARLLRQERRRKNKIEGGENCRGLGGLP